MNTLSIPQILGLLALGFSMTPLRGEVDESAAELLDVSPGARLVETTSEYDTRWMAPNLVNGSGASGWCSAKKAVFPHRLVFKLAEPAVIHAIEVINAVDELKHPGISAKRLKLEVSSTGEEEAWSPLTQLELKKGGEVQLFDSVPTKARWVRLTIDENHGHPDYTELMNLRLLGEYVSENREPIDITGVWKSSWRGSTEGSVEVRLQREGDRVIGEYDHFQGRLSGGFDQRVMVYRWTQSNGSGTVTVAINAEGDAFQGYWLADSEEGPLGWWRFEKISSGIEEPIEDNHLEKEIEKTGRAVVYGINFAFDSANILPSSSPVLQKVSSILIEHPDWRFRVTGHTDSEGSDSYNMKLSERRASAVVAWLSSRQGIASGRLAAEGLGESQPVATNDSELGRAANRRVELIRMGSPGER